LSICHDCGIYGAPVMESPDRRYTVIIVRALASPPPELPPRGALSFEGEQAAERNSLLLNPVDAARGPRRSRLSRPPER
jgi:hypothetical protein